MATDDSQLAGPTPCPDSTVGDFTDHIGTLAEAFATKAQKRDDIFNGPPPGPNAANLTPGWRDRISRHLEALAAPSAWEDIRRPTTRLRSTASSASPAATRGGARSQSPVADRARATWLASALPIRRMY